MEREKIDLVMKNLKERQFDPYFADSKEEVIPLVRRLMEGSTTAAMGGSETLAQTGVADMIRREYEVIEPAEGADRDEIKKVMRERFSADAFLLSANAITADGRIFQEDGASTRVAPMIYGPDRVIIIAGINKLTGSEAEARRRVKAAACENCRRRGFATPCAEDGRCHECRVPARSCCTSVTLNFSRIPGRIKVILVGESLGI